MSRAYLARHRCRGALYEPPANRRRKYEQIIFSGEKCIYIARDAGRIGLPIQVHFGGASGYFNQSGANPFVLEKVLNDPGLRSTQFILSVRGPSEVLRLWLEYVPEKVLFGTDAFEISEVISWADHGWLTVSSARQALALALTGMMSDGEITRERALELAAMVMRNNAIKVYKLEQQ